MIRNGEFYVLKHMKQQGMSTTRIAEELGCRMNKMGTSGFMPAANVLPNTRRRRDVISSS